MWNIRDLKAKGKAAFRANYWRCVAAGLVLSIPDTTLYARGFSRLENWIEQLEGTMARHGPKVTAVVAMAVAGMLSAVVLVEFLLQTFVFNPLRVGCGRFFVENGRKPANLHELTCAFRHSYFNVVKTMLLRDLFLNFWSLLFLIPGIVKAYSYCLVPYILAEDPGISGKKAITVSRYLMHGNKMKAFLLDLSFVGWNILAVLTLGLVGTFYSQPYRYAAGAELYKAIRSDPNFAGEMPPPAAY